MGRKEALELAAGANEIYSAKGKKITHIKLRDKPADEDILAAMLGPTGNLRAPTVRRGKTLIVGFNAETYEKFFG